MTDSNKTKKQLIEELEECRRQICELSTCSDEKSMTKMLASDVASGELLNYEKIISSSSDMLAMLDTNFVYLAANDKYASAFNLRPAELIGMTASDVFGLEFFESDILPKANKCLQGREVRFQNWIEFSADGRRCVDVAYSPFYNSDKKIEGFIVNGRDITRRIKAEDALRDSEERLIESQSVAKLGHYVLDLATGCWTCSAALDEIFGIDDKYKKDVASWLDFVHPDHREAMSTYLQEDVLGQKGKFDKEYRIINMKTGDEKWVHGLGRLKIDEYGNVFEMFGTIQDITVHKLAEQERERSRKFLQTVIDGFPDSLIVINRDYTIAMANKSVRGMAGKIDPVASCLRCHQVFHNSMTPCEDVDTPCTLRLVLKTKTTWQDERTHKYADGKSTTVELTAVPIFDEKGEVIQIIVSTRDITEIKRLRELESRAGRLATAGTIAGQVAHDFNNLLAPLMAYPELIHEELPHDSQAHAYLDTIEDAARKIAEINQDLLTMGRRGHYEQSVIDLNRIVLHAVKDMESQTETMSIEMELCEELMRIKGGSAQIHRVLINLLVNAQDAMQNVGQITIKTENCYADDTSVSFGRVPKGEYVKVTVTDTGCGIADDIMQKILDPFFSTKTADRKRGSGLGLSVVDAVIKDHHGYLDMSSAVGQGTSFFLYFPATRDDVSVEGLLNLVGGTEKVLIVDDDNIQREVSSKLLTKLGYEVCTAESGEQAIAFLRDNPQDLVVLDMVMPGGIDGAETYRQIIEFSKEQKAIILSGFSESDRVLEAQRLGAGPFIRKPVSKQVIAAAVRSELDRRLCEKVSDTV